jgi:hypothetical protein
MIIKYLKLEVYRMKYKNNSKISNNVNNFNLKNIKY